MKKPTTVAEYIAGLTPDRVKPFKKLRQTIKKNLPKGFQEGFAYGMICYVVPKSLYPAGYHAAPGLPLGLLSLASQKGHIAVYHMGIYGDRGLKTWFAEEFASRSAHKLDIGGGCIRLKYLDDIPYDLFGELASRITPEEWIIRYDNFKKEHITRKRSS